MVQASSRSSFFPSSFLFGLSTSSIQIEGATCKGGRGQGIWDTFACIPGKIADGSTPEIACNHYNMFQDDILEMKRLGMDAYRFSISWPRLFPASSNYVNEEGILFYNAIIDCVMEAGLVPFVTLYHWDLPQYLEDDPDVNGWRSKKIVEHFLIFANTCFYQFGDRVKHWITFNEIHLNTFLAYGAGILAPGRCSKSEPYLVAHNELLSHAAAVKLYRSKYQKDQKGVIGLSIDVMWYEPVSDLQVDKDAAQRFLEFEMGWIMNPVQFGDYPLVMHELVGERLPKFTKIESWDLKGSVDFIGINYYSAMWARNATKNVNDTTKPLWWTCDSQAEFCWRDKEGKLLGEPMGPPGDIWFRSCPSGLRKVLSCIDERYGKLPIYITENGTIDRGSNLDLKDALNDLDRIKFLQDHFQEVSDSIRQDKVNVQGYFIWTFMDNWEWMNGYKLRFGLYHVDFNDPGLPRRPKASAKWLSSYLAN